MAPLGGGPAGCFDFNVIRCIIINRTKNFGIDNLIKLCIPLINMSKLASFELYPYTAIYPWHHTINFNFGLGGLNVNATLGQYQGCFQAKPEISPLEL